jgi:hypothetical protein
MNDILPLREENASGLVTLSVAVVSEIISIDRAFNKTVSAAPVFVAGKRFYSLAYSQQSAGLSTESAITIAGDVWKTQVQLFVPKLQLLTSQVIDELMRGVVLVAQDSNGNKRLVGNLNEPMRLKVEANTLAVFGGRAGYTFTFYRDMIAEPPFYTA